MTENQNLSVDINESTSEALIKVRGIGPSLAQSIIENRPYHDLHELVKVPGINEIKLASLVPYLTLEKPQQESRQTEKSVDESEAHSKKPITKIGDTEAFLFLEDKKEREDALLIIFGGFIIGLIILMLRRRSQ